MTYKERPGDARGSALAYQQQMVRLAGSLMSLEGVLEELFESDTEVSGLSIRVPNTMGADYLLTVRARFGSERKVAFHVAATFAEVLRGFVVRLGNGSLRWKEDEYERK